MVGRTEFGTHGTQPSALPDYLRGEDLPRLDVSLRTLIATSMRRTDRWHGPEDNWSLADWSNAMAGEAGECCNQVKKIRRHETATDKTRGDDGVLINAYNTPPLPMCVGKALEEAADNICYTVLVAGKLMQAYPELGLDFVDILIDKFNSVSEIQGFPERLP